MKLCPTCHEQKPQHAFRERSKRGKRVLYGECRECERSKYRDYYYADPEKSRERIRRGNLARRGVDRAWFESVLAAQGGGCAICGSAVGSGRWDTLHVDHDHRCCPGDVGNCPGCVRGLLCGNCNLALGKFGDSLGVLKSAVRYLSKWEGLEHEG